MVVYSRTDPNDILINNWVTISHSSLYYILIFCWSFYSQTFSSFFNKYLLYLQNQLMLFINDFNSSIRFIHILIVNIFS